MCTHFGGKPLINAKKPITLTIQPCDIRGAIRGDPENCAAARCVRRTDPKVKLVKINRRVAYVLRGGVARRYRVNNRTFLELFRLDVAGAFTPGDYTLEPMRDYERPTGRRQGGNSTRISGKTRAPGLLTPGMRPPA
jgi:hypothetical protein